MQEPLPLKHVFDMIKLPINSNFQYYQTIYKTFGCCHYVES